MERFIFLLFRVLSRFPLPVMQGIGVGLGWLVWLLSPTYRRRIQEHASAAGFTPAQYHGSVSAMGAMFGELPWLWMRPVEETVLNRIEWQGAEALERVLQAKKGAIVITPHLGCWEMVGQSLGERYAAQYGSMTALFRPARKEWLTALVAHSRNRPFLQMFPTGLSGVRNLLRTLRNGGYVGILPDQVPPAGMGAWANMWGRPAYTMTLISRLTQQSGAPVVLCWCERLGCSGRYRMHLELLKVEDAPALYDPEATPEQAAADLNASIEKLITYRPDQYLWSYARYKQPKGE